LGINVIPARKLAPALPRALFFLLCVTRALHVAMPFVVMALRLMVALGFVMARALPPAMRLGVRRGGVSVSGSDGGAIEGERNSSGGERRARDNLRLH
jgi:hypothetical protein